MKDNAASQKRQKIRFDELSLVLIGMDFEDDNIDADSAILYSALGSEVEGRKMFIDTEGIDSLTVEQAYVTSVTIQGEGPHCDLLDWRHFYSGYKEAMSLSDDTFLINTYSENERMMFPKVSINELKTYVRKNCGSACYESIRTIKSVMELPLTVMITRYYIRIKGVKKHSRKRFQKKIIINQALGC